MTSELEAGVRLAIKRLSDDTTIEAAGVKITLYWTSLPYCSTSVRVHLKQSAPTVSPKESSGSTAPLQAHGNWYSAMDLAYPLARSAF